jgi:hypothetical protein
MAFSPNKNDLSLLGSIAEYKVLTVGQLSVLSQRSRQVIRRRLRILESEEIIATEERGYGRSRGRPESLIFLTEKGAMLLKDKRILSKNVACTTNMSADSIFIAHELLINWFHIHLVQMERVIPQLSVNYLSPGFHSSALTSGDRPPLLERVHTKNSQKEFIEFIPDGIFSIKEKEMNKTLLFFLEVDMGTETIASMDRDPKDIRQKILNFQTLFHSSHYKRYERIFNSKLNGFRLLFLTNTASRLAALSRLVKEMPPSDFIWLTDQQRMFTHGVSAEIWTRGGRYDDPPQSILGPKLACETPVSPIIM